MLAWTVQGIVNKSCISFQSRRDAKDVLLAVMGQADTLARCAGCAHCPCCLQYHGYHQLNHHHHFHPQAMPRVAFQCLLLNLCYIYLLTPVIFICYQTSLSDVWMTVCESAKRRKFCPMELEQDPGLSLVVELIEFEENQCRSLLMLWPDHLDHMTTYTWLLTIHIQDGIFYCPSDP